MEEAAFESQISEADRLEIGRMTINFGYVELLLDWLLQPAFGIKDSFATRELVSPLPLDRKIKLMRSALERCPTEEVNQKISEGLRLISLVKDDRNTVTHGYWALVLGRGAAVFKRKGDPKPADIKSISEIADHAAAASRLLYDAYDLLNGRDPSRSAPDILSPNDDGSFTVIRKAAGSAVASASANASAPQNGELP